jgi:hypothetical protein
MNPAPIMQEDGEENKNTITGYHNETLTNISLQRKWKSPVHSLNTTALPFSMTTVTEIDAYNMPRSTLKNKRLNT